MMSKEEFEHRKKLRNLELKVWRAKQDYMGKVNVGIVIGGAFVLLVLSLLLINLR